MSGHPRVRLRTPAQHGALLSIVALMACGPASDATRWTSEVADSGGISVTVHGGEPPADQEVWPAVQVASLDGDEGDGAGFYGFRGAVLLADGTVAVNHATGTELLYMRPDGARVRTIRATGSGPEEFVRIDNLVHHPDGGVAALDGSLGKVLVFAPDGAFVRAVTLDVSGGRPQLQGVLRDGSLVALRFGASTMEGNVSRRAVEVVRYAADGSFAGVLQTVPSAGMVMAELAGRRRQVPLPFDADPLVAVAGDRVYTADPRAGEVRVYAGGERLERIFRRDNPRRTVTAEDRRLHSDELLGMSQDPAMQAQWRDYLAAVPWPDAHPAFYRMLADDAGHLYLLEPGDCGDAPTCWNVYDDRGQLLAGLRHPPPSVPLQVHAGMVLGLAFPEVSVPLLTLHRVEQD